MSKINQRTVQLVASPSTTKNILKENQLAPKKSLGQNFITDQNILEKMILAAELDASKAVVEIGPGLGALTQKLAQISGAVLAFEIDQRLIPILNRTFVHSPHVKIVHGDILKINIQEYIPDEFNAMSGVCVVANLPYYITTPILFKLLESSLSFDFIVVMIQKEVAMRLCAQPGSKDYGSLSISIQYHCLAEIVTQVPRTVFVPQPNVDSAIIRLKRRENPLVVVDDEHFFFEVIRNSFSQRRKTILNNLQAKYPELAKNQDIKTILTHCEIDSMRRAETLSIHEFAKLAHALHSATHAKN